MNKWNENEVEERIYTKSIPDQKPSSYVNQNSHKIRISWMLDGGIVPYFYYMAANTKYLMIIVLVLNYRN